MVPPMVRSVFMTAAIQTVSNVFTANTVPIVARSSQVSVGTAGSVTVPSTLVTLGTASSSSVPGEAQTLFDALLQAAFGSQDTSGTSTDTQTTGNATGTSVADLAALLGLDTSVTSSDLLNASVGSQNIAAIVAQAVTSSVTSDVTSTSTNPTDTSSINQSLIQLLASTLNSGGSTLDNATAASLLSATGILPGQATSDTRQAAASLLTINPGVAATVLNLNNTSSGLSDLTGAQAVTMATTTDQSQLAPLTPVMNLATATLGESSVSDTAALSNVSTSSVAAVQAASTTVATATTPVATNSITSTTSDVTATTATVAATTAASANSASDTTTTTSAVSNNFLQDYAAQALANIAGNPAYADIAGILYMSAMIFHSQLPSADKLPETTRITQPVYAVQPVNAL